MLAHSVLALKESLYILFHSYNFWCFFSSPVFASFCFSSKDFIFKSFFPLALKKLAIQTWCIYSLKAIRFKTKDSSGWHLPMYCWKTWKEQNTIWPRVDFINPFTLCIKLLRSAPNSYALKKLLKSWALGA